MLGSYNEVQSVVCKAALAVGVPYGPAELAGVSAAWLHVNGYAGISVAKRAIDNLDRDNARPVMLNQELACFQADGDHKLASALYAAPSITDLLRTSLHIAVVGLDEPLMLLSALVRYSNLWGVTCSLDISNANSHINTLIGDGKHAIDDPDTLGDSTDAGFNISINVVSSAETCVAKVPESNVIRSWRSTQEISPVIQRHWHDLQRLAAKNLVPESLKSKKDGAGAGIIDND